MTRPKPGGYVHKRLVEQAQHASSKARRQLQQALGAQSPQAQATLLCACALSMAEVTATLGEIRALLDAAASSADVTEGERGAGPPRPPCPGSRTGKR